MVGDTSYCDIVSERKCIMLMTENSFGMCLCLRTYSTFNITGRQAGKHTGLESLIAEILMWNELESAQDVNHCR